MPEDPKDTEIMPPGKNLPPGTKQVRVHRTETYQEPLATADQPAERAEEIDESDPTLEAAPLGPLAFEDDDDPISPLDQLLNSLQEDSADVVIYIKRKTDPIQCNFKRPYIGPTRTVGELPFDDSFTTQMAVELTAQRVYGGGYYQFQLYQRSANRYIKGWSAVIDDPVEPPPPPPAPEKPTPAPQPIPDNSFKSFAQQAREFAETAKSLGLGRNSRNEDDGRTLPPAPNPVEQVQSSVAMIQSLLSISKSLQPEPPAGSGDNRSLMRDALDVSRELGIGEAVREFVRPLAGIGGALLAQSLRERQIKAAQQARGGNTPHPPPQPREMAGGTVEHSNVPRETSNVPRTAYAPAHSEFNAVSMGVMGAGMPQQTEDQSVQQLPAEAIAFLGTVVEDMLEGAEDDSDETLNRAVQRTQAVLLLQPEAQQYVDDILRKSAFELLAWLGEVNAEWKLLIKSRDAGTYVSWLDDFKTELRDAVKGAAQQEDPKQDPAAALDLSALTAPEPVTASADVGAPTSKEPRKTTPRKSKEAKK